MSRIIALIRLNLSLICHWNAVRQATCNNGEDKAKTVFRTVQPVLLGHFVQIEII